MTDCNDWKIRISKQFLEELKNPVESEQKMSQLLRSHVFLNSSSFLSNEIKTFTAQKWLKR